MSQPPASAATSLSHFGGVFLDEEDLFLAIDFAPAIDESPHNPEGYFVWAVWMPTKSAQMTGQKAMVSHLNNGKWLWWMPKSVDRVTNATIPAYFEIKKHP